jgi:hypothetical protein
MKRNLIKELEAMGIRKAEKPGVGMVKLGHLKTHMLISLLAEAKAKAAE